MKKLLAPVLAMVCLLSLIGCSKQPKVVEPPKDIPVPEYPLSKETIETAMKKAGFIEGIKVGIHLATEII